VAKSIFAGKTIFAVRLMLMWQNVFLLAKTIFAKLVNVTKMEH